MSIRVVIVDDDSFYAEILEDLLSMQGYASRHFLSGAECLAALAHDAGAEAISAFILDVVMPDMDGYALCERLRADPRFRHTPILFVSSKSSLEDRMRGYEAGGTDYLSKPAQPEELKAKLRLAIDNSRGQAAERSAAPAVSSPGGIAGADTVLAFVQESLDAATVEVVADAVLRAVDQLGLAGSVMVRSDTRSLFQTSDGSPSPIERELLELTPPNQNLIEFNKRLIVNLPVVALLVRRLPELSPAEATTLKQRLLMLGRVADQKAGILRKEEMLAQQKRYWIELLIAAEQGINAVKGNNAYAGSTVQEVMEEFLITLNEGILDLALDTDQEVQLKAMLRHNAERVIQSLNPVGLSAAEAQKPFQALIEKLNQAL